MLNKRLFIALDIDGVLNNYQTHKEIERLDNEDMLPNNISCNQSVFVTSENSDIQFAIEKITYNNGNIENRISYGAYILLSKLALLNSIIAQAQACYMDVFVFGISSWFASQRLILNQNEHLAKQFFHFNQDVHFEKASPNNTVGDGTVRTKAFCQFLDNNNGSKNDIALYLDDTPADKTMIANRNERFIVPDINGRYGLLKEHLNKSKCSL